MNAKTEFTDHTQGKKVKCAAISWPDHYDEISDSWETDELYLKVDHSQLDFAEFLKKLDYEYDSGYGGQNLYGTIWYEDGTWSSRGEYDGSEWWEFNQCPEIDENCL